MEKEILEFSIKKLSKKWRSINTISTLVVAGILLAYAILSFADLTAGVVKIMLNIIYVLFAIKLLLWHFNIKMALSFFGYMGNLLGKGVFIILVGITMFDNSFNVSTILAILIVVWGVWLTVMYFIPNKDKEPEGKKSSEGSSDKKDKYKDAVQ